MNPASHVPDEGAPNAGEDVSDATEPAEEYELDQLADQRADTEGQSMSDQPSPDERGPESR